jgi:hypothetical protein
MRMFLIDLVRKEGDVIFSFIHGFSILILRLA